ncbi:MAG: hypothetical protein DRJ38_08505 [Thermoprotei archaeon]|nr:MAG: hypothetical protein DRJ38_08505 [Thermoprotei archaeon]
MSIKAVALDVDGVITEISSVWRYIHERLGTLEAAKINAEKYRRGEIDYVEWARLDVALWKNVDMKTIKNIVDSIPIRRGSSEFFKFLKHCRLTIIALSAGLDVVTDRLKRMFEIDYALANKLIVKDGIITGEVEVYVGYYDKGEILKKICNKIGIKTENCIAIGDSEVDIPMFEEANIGIAFNPKDWKTAEKADIVVYSSDLRSLIPVVEMFIKT